MVCLGCGGFVGVEKIDGDLETSSYDVAGLVLTAFARLASF
jgi:hypothetical protein